MVAGNVAVSVHAVGHGDGDPAGVVDQVVVAGGQHEVPVRSWLAAWSVVVAPRAWVIPAPASDGATAAATSVASPATRSVALLFIVPAQ